AVPELGGFCLEVPLVPSRVQGGRGWAVGSKKSIYSIELMYYSKCKVRSELNTATGVLVVRNMTTGNTGVYSVEINNKVQSQVYQTMEIQEVPQLTVDLQPLACTQLKCGLKCHGVLANTKPVSYFWKKDDGGWELSGDKKELKKNINQLVLFIFCGFQH
uniref:Ig-like domain-containing protein n=1 Tax=Amphilophus citrinellus TaxID=61819 RepID=A0A3Q0SPK7_AMPCI